MDKIQQYASELRLAKRVVKQLLELAPDVRKRVLDMILDAMKGQA